MVMIQTEPFDIEWVIVIVMMCFYTPRAVVAVYLASGWACQFACVDCVLYGTNCFTAVGIFFCVSFSVFNLHALSMFTLFVGLIAFLLLRSMSIFSVFEISVFLFICVIAQLAATSVTKGVVVTFDKFVEWFGRVALGTGSYNLLAWHVASLKGV